MEGGERGAGRHAVLKQNFRDGQQMDAPFCLRVVCLQMLCCHWRFPQVSLLTRCGSRLCVAASDFLGCGA
jgi:hypothetical protein